MKRGLDAYKLKLIAVAFMILDHIFSYLNMPFREFLNWEVMPEWIPLLTRFVSPLFLYLMIDGFYHTSSSKNFLKRLSIAAVVVWIGNLCIKLAFHQISGLYSVIEGHNIFLTLALLFAFIWSLENIKEGKDKNSNICIAVVCAFVCVFCEGGIYLLPVAVIAWKFYGRKNLQCVGIGVWSLVLLETTLISYFSIMSRPTPLFTYLCFDNEWAMFAVIFFILLYNGERGKNTPAAKYMFYGIYPIHIWILLIIRLAIAGS